jgi:cell division protein FtsZ
MSDKFLVRKTKIRVIGIGGGGGSIVSELAKKIKRASFFAANTDSQALKKMPKRIHQFQIGKELTRGLGTGMDPELGRTVAENDKKRIERILERPDFCIFVACLGGGTGSGATPVFAKISENLNSSINLGIFTFPFDFEGDKRKMIAKKALKELEPHLNGILLIRNQRIFRIIDKKTPLASAFEEVNKVLARDLENLIDLIYKPGLINIDFADFKSILSGRKKRIYFSTAKAEGPNRAEQVSRKILSSSLVDFNIEKSDRFLFNISTSSNLKMREVEEICNTFSSLNKKAKIVFGIEEDSSLSKSEIKVTLLIAGKKREAVKKNVEKVEVKEKLEKKPFLEKKEKDEKDEKNSSLGSEKKKKKKGKKRKIKKKGEKDKKEQKEKIKETEPEEKKEEKLEIRTEKSSRKKKEKRRLNALEIKKASQEKEMKRLAKEERWEVPAFLRRSPWKEKIKKFNKEQNK